MRAIRAYLDRQGYLFEPGRRLARLRAIHIAQDAFLFTPGTVTHGTVHVRDAISLRRMMAVVMLALAPCALWAMYNTGLQANLALDPAKIDALAGWRHAVLRGLGVGYAPESIVANLIHGALYFLPLYAVTFVVGRFWEILFAAFRGHELDEGFYVTALVFPLILPPTTPLWQAALAISWGIVIAKQVFGGTGMNFLNAALVARAFLFYAYPAQIIGERLWVPVSEAHVVDGFSGATALGEIRKLSAPFTGDGLSWWNAFVGLEPGSMGETSALMCLIGAAILIWTRIYSWRTMAAAALGTVVAAELFNFIGSETNPAFAVPFWWHMVMGGWAFGIVFLATDPVTSAFTTRGMWLYGFMVGALAVVIRVVNPAYPESIMLVILFMNVFAPLIDYYVVRANVRRRRARGAG